MCIKNKNMMDLCLQEEGVETGVGLCMEKVLELCHGVKLGVL